jgi:protein phosphatase
MHRETDDHSIVEEEVRAGRMTPEQAANHPSKNVISRALGAEESVEADMKVIEVADGSAFLLCTDGITRHIPDRELRELLMSEGTPAQLCEEMKRRCYQRGAEDNLTAVIVQVGTPTFERHAIEDETTASFEMEPTEVPAVSTAVARANGVQLTPASRIAFPPPSPVEQIPAANAVTAKSRGGRGVFRFLVFVLFIAAAAGAFYARMIYQRQKHAVMTTTNAQPSPSPQSTFAGKRSAVDADPQKWINDTVPAQLAKESIPKPADSKDPEFLYLYGRALTETGDHRGASEAFQFAINNLRSENSTALSLDSEIKLADAAATLKLNKTSDPSPSQQTSMAEDKVIRILDETVGLKRETPPR